ncbi:MAG: glycoside hydrolase family 95 protein [Ruminococcaceae bacterium]|nr:glycoside hydrolase family 95 protein [Oscillospiraceae bacterium]
MSKELTMWYTSPAPMEGDDVSNIYVFERQIVSDNDGWEKWSLPIGCGWFGANIFGRTETERVQITENSFQTVQSWNKSVYPNGLANFAELYLDFGHKEVTDYRRYLSLDNAIAGVTYNYNGVKYEREYIASYPDKCLVVSLTASENGKLSFTMRPEFPYGGAHREEPYKYIEGNTIIFGGIFGKYRVQFEAQFELHVNGGTVKAGDGVFCVEGADSAYIVAVFGTNYKMDKQVFLEDNFPEKLNGFPHPHDKLTTRLAETRNKDYAELRARHIADYKSLFDRVTLDLGEEMPCIPTNELLEQYKVDQKSRYLETLFFQYGRYLLISSSRPNTYPANLQGTWNKYDAPPFGSGYWYNINVQMTYWPAFVTNITETIEPLVEWIHTAMETLENRASEYVKKMYPDRFEEGQGANGWGIGCTNWLYKMHQIGIATHTGPGVAPFTMLMFWDYYEFTEDKKLLCDIVYPWLKSLCVFLNKILIEKDGKWLVENSASPEQLDPDDEAHVTVGCTFDQSMIWECFNETIKAAEILGDNDPIIDIIKGKINDLDHMMIGVDNNIKEFREEVHYGDIGQKNHRHISQLVGLYPGTSINKYTPEYLKAAENTLELRGDVATGWGMAHRINAWARVFNGKRAHDVLKQLLSLRIMPNLWDLHPPFQIDGNFGATSGIAEMLLQSHMNDVDILPCLPPDWQIGSFTGLRARGGITVDAKWADCALIEATVKADADREIRIAMAECTVKDAEGNVVETVKNGSLTSFAAKAGVIYTVIPA